MSIQFKELRGDLLYSVTVPPTAADTGIEVPIVELPFAALITGVTWVPGAAIAANGTNFFTLSARNREAGAGTKVAATRAYDTGDSVATTPEVLTLSGTATDLEAAEGDLLTAEFAHTAAGLAIPSGLVQVQLRIAG